MRRLATIQTVHSIKPIEGADAIELVLIQGWQCVSKKGEFKPGDICVYYEVDSYLPIDERYEFLRRTSYRNNDFMGEGFRVKTIAMRGEISQGLALPIQTSDGVRVFPELEDRQLVVGSDVTQALGIRKWEMPEMASSAGTEIGEKPFGIPTTDENRLQSMPEYLDAFRGKPYYITTKMDGTSCTIYCKDGQVGVCGRNKEYKEDTGSCAMWAWVYKRGIKEKLLALGENIAVQGEFCGAGIQKNRLKLMEPDVFVFDMVRLLENGARPKMGMEELKTYSEKLGMNMVPIEEYGDSFDYTQEQLLEKARGKYTSGMDKEGIVVRTQEMGSAAFRLIKDDGSEGDVVRRLSFKVLNNDFLKKEKD